MSPLSKATFTDAFFETFSPLMVIEGFGLQKKSNRYFRKHPDRHDCLFLIFIKEGPSWRIRAGAGIRYPQVEDIFHKTSGFNKKYHLGTLSVGGSLAEIAEKSPRTFEFVVSTSEEAKFAAEEIFHVYQEYLVPYYAQWSNLNAIDVALNDHPEDKAPGLRGGPPWFRCSIGVIVAKLVGRPNYDELAAFYSDVVSRTTGGFYFDRFKNLLESLRTQTLSAR